MKRDCNKYRFGEINIGIIEQFDCVILENMQNVFTDITGDINRGYEEKDLLANSLFQFLFLHIF